MPAHKKKDGNNEKNKKKTNTFKTIYKNLLSTQNKMRYVKKK